jgi:hypothetical protein
VHAWVDGLQAAQVAESEARALVVGLQQELSGSVRDMAAAQAAQREAEERAASLAAQLLSAQVISHTGKLRHCSDATVLLTHPAVGP